MGCNIPPMQGLMRPPPPPPPPPKRYEYVGYQPKRSKDMGYVVPKPPGRQTRVSYRSNGGELYHGGCHDCEHLDPRICKVCYYTQGRKCLSMHSERHPETKSLDYIGDRIAEFKAGMTPEERPSYRADGGRIYHGGCLDCHHIDPNICNICCHKGPHWDRKNMSNVSSKTAEAMVQSYKAAKEKDMSVAGATKMVPKRSGKGRLILKVGSYCKPTVIAGGKTCFCRSSFMWKEVPDVLVPRGPIRSDSMTDYLQNSVEGTYFGRQLSSINIVSQTSDLLELKHAASREIYFVSSTHKAYMYRGGSIWNWGDWTELVSPPLCLPPPPKPPGPRNVAF